MHTTRHGRFLLAIGSPKAVRFIFAGMLVYALVIGGLMLGYADVQHCLANYTDAAARSAQTRAAAAAQDRALNARIEAVSLSDRQRIIANQKASQELIEKSIETDGAVPDEVLLKYTKISDESLRIFLKNEEERAAINEQRRRVEALRDSAPAPDAPSDSC